MEQPLGARSLASTCVDSTFFSDIAQPTAALHATSHSNVEHSYHRGHFCYPVTPDIGHPFYRAMTSLDALAS
jgi:hypothetical protein